MYRNHIGENWSVHHAMQVVASELLSKFISKNRTFRDDIT